MTNLAPLADLGKIKFPDHVLDLNGPALDYVRQHAAFVVESQQPTNRKSQ